MPVPIPASRVLPAHLVYELPSAAGPQSQLIHAAIDLGLAEGAVEATLNFVKNRARPWIDSGLDKATDDPFTLRDIGILDAHDGFGGAAGIDEQQGEGAGRDDARHKGLDRQIALFDIGAARCGRRVHRDEPVAPAIFETVPGIIEDHRFGALCLLGEFGEVGVKRGLVGVADDSGRDPGLRKGIADIIDVVDRVLQRRQDGCDS